MTPTIIRVYYKILICYHFNIFVWGIVLNYEAVEESPVGTILCILKEERELQTLYSKSHLENITFKFLDQSEEAVNYFSIHDKGALKIKKIIDREHFCPSQESCQLSITLATQPITQLNVIKLLIDVIDLNDDRPSFVVQNFNTGISEASPLGTLVSLPTAVDRDAPTHAIVGYTMIETDNHNTEVFKLRYHLKKTESVGRRRTSEEEDGAVDDGREFLALELIGSLDRETTNFYYFIVIAWDNETAFHQSLLKNVNPENVKKELASIPTTSKLLVEIQIKDVNDNRPQFEKNKYEIELPENVSPGTNIIQVFAIDPDEEDNGRIEFSFSNKTKQIYGTMFSIDSNKGWIKLQPLTTLDHEIKKQYVLEVIARDFGEGESFDLALVLIKITDINDNKPSIRFDPELESEKCCWTVSEGLPKDTRIATVSAFDPDLNGADTIKCRLRYNRTIHQDIVSNRKSKAFDLLKLTDSEYVVIVSTDDLDREDSPMHHVTITCHDGGSPVLSSSRDVIISIDDVNDNEPIFKKELFVFNISESSRPFEILFTMEARDDDIGSNSDIRYQIKTRQRAFEIDSTSGAIWSTIKLDRERKSLYNFRVVAEDMGTPKKRSTCHVQVNIIDENDEMPRFPEPMYQINVEENTAIGTVIGQIEAFDSDLPPYNSVYYELELITEPVAEINDPFDLLPHTTDHELNNDEAKNDDLDDDDDLDGDDDFDGDDDLDDKYGYINYDQKSMSDEWNYLIRGNQHFHHSSNLIDDVMKSSLKRDVTKILPFVINPTNGEISLALYLDRETHSEYKMNVFAKDSHNPEMYDVAIVVVTVVDVNDNPPRITFPSDANFTISVTEFLMVDQFLAQMQSIDEDEGSNSQLKFEIEGIFNSAPFDSDIHQDVNATKQMKRNNVQSLVDEFWRNNVRVVDKSETKMPKMVSKIVSRHFFVDQESGKMFGRNMKTLVDLIKTKVSTDDLSKTIFSSFVVVISVKDSGDPALESYAFVMVTMDGVKFISLNESSIGSVLSTNESSSIRILSNSETSRADAGRWFWIALISTFASLLILLTLILIVYCLCIRCCAKKRREKSNSIHSRLSTEIVRLNDGVGGIGVFFGDRRDSSPSNREPPSLLSKRKQSNKSSDGLIDVPKTDPTLYFDGMRSSNYYFPSLESQNMDFIEDSESSNIHSNRESFKTDSVNTSDYNWTNTHDSLKLTKLSLWTNNSNLGDVSDRNFVKGSLKRKQASANENERLNSGKVDIQIGGFKWNFLSNTDTMNGINNNDGSFRILSGENPYFFANDNHVNPARIAGNKENKDVLSLTPSLTFKKPNTQIYQTTLKSLDGLEDPNYSSNRRSRFIDDERLYSNKLMTFGSSQRTDTQESRLSNMSVSNSPQIKRYQAIGYAMKPPVISSVMSDPLKKRSLPSAKQFRNSEIYRP